LKVNTGQWVVDPKKYWVTRTSRYDVEALKVINIKDGTEGCHVGFLPGTY
jgi:hypothetical protein